MKITINIFTFDIYDRIAKFFSRFRRGGIYYINGPETLPPPLSKEEENEIITRLEGNEEARQKLIEHNLRLVVYIAKRFENTGTGIEDLISIGTIGLVKAINTFRSDKNIKLATYASRCIENEILMYIRKNSGKSCEISIEELLNTDYDGNELLLADVLGGDDDQVYRELEIAEDKKTIRRALSELSEYTDTPIPAPLASLADKTVRHTGVIAREDMENATLEFVKN